MDGKRFDELSRSFAQGRTRRGVLKGLAGGLAAGVAALTGRGTVSAQRLPLGSACTRATQCASLKCADGVCCDSQCTGQCEACDLQGSLGACTPVPAGTQQWGNRPACTGTDVCQASCDGVERRFCTQYPGFDIPCNTGECVNGWGITFGCGGDGTCHPLGEDCGPYVCDAAGVACLTSCTRDEDCAGDAVCDVATGTCRDKLPLGEHCTADSQCLSGYCVDGVCCVERCGTCEVCNAPGNEGFCGPGPDNVACGVDDLCCEGECIDVQIDVEHCGRCDNTCVAIPNGRAVCLQGVCDVECLPGFQRCDFPTLVCIPESGCCGDTECPGTQFCDLNSHTCAPDRPVGGSCTRACGPLPANECSTDAMCLSGVCREGAGVCGCAADGDCPANQFCDPATNLCMADLPLGGSCNRAAQCTSGICAANGGTACGCGTIRVSGSQTDPNAPINIDNFYDVYLNGNPTSIHHDDSGAATPVPAWSFAANPGDTIRVVAVDFGGLKEFGPIFLHCVATGAVQVLTPPPGSPFVPEQASTTPFGVNEVIFDATFTINL